MVYNLGSYKMLFRQSYRGMCSGLVWGELRSAGDGCGFGVHDGAVSYRILEWEFG